MLAGVKFAESWLRRSTRCSCYSWNTLCYIFAVKWSQMRLGSGYVSNASVMQGGWKETLIDGSWMAGHWSGIVVRLETWIQNVPYMMLYLFLSSKIVLHLPALLSCPECYSIIAVAHNLDCAAGQAAIQRQDKFCDAEYWESKVGARNGRIPGQGHPPLRIPQQQRANWSSCSWPAPNRGTTFSQRYQKCR